MRKTPNWAWCGEGEPKLKEEELYSTNTKDIENFNCFGDYEFDNPLCDVCFPWKWLCKEQKEWDDFDNKRGVIPINV